MSAARYAVGLDLGTTHCVLSSIDLTLADDTPEVTVFALPQLVAPGELQALSQLPSFLYLAHAAELVEGASSLPWNAQPPFLVGEVARQLGSKTPIRLVSSAKSWLCHSGVDCKQALLPVDAPDDIVKVSPFTATQAYLQHISDAWNHAHLEDPLHQQALTITVPASFDPAARDLTVEAAHSVGLQQAILLEEPQAALYSWIENSEGDWRNHVSVGDVILVVDVGGGTTDLSLIAVTEEQGNLQLTRVAVGEHILLGGDNMDLALAYTVRAKIEADSGKRLEPWQVQALGHGCRHAKEQLFSNPDLNSVPLVVASRGSSLFGGTLRSDLTRDELYRVLIEGFLPVVASSDKPMVKPRGGLRSVGLPYAQDAAITRHLAGFLSKQRDAAVELTGLSLPEQAGFLHPTALLFNGGVFKATPLAERLLAVLNQWLSEESAAPARVLAGADLDLAVARGAAYYGYVRQGKGVRIKGGTAAAYYVGVESAMPAVPGLPPEIEALCIAPFGMEEGSEQVLPNAEFGLVVGEPVRFRFFASKTRRDDAVGLRLETWSDDALQELDEIEVTLPEEGRQSGEVVPVQLSAAVSDIGTLELRAISRRDQQQWKIEFDVRHSEN
jgi:hypothetical protein